MISWGGDPAELESVKKQQEQEEARQAEIQEAEEE